MTPANFPETNFWFGPPPDMTSEQVSVIHAWQGQSTGGSVDGVPMVVVAWQPSEQEVRDIVAGNPVFLTVMGGGLPPHFLTTQFNQAVNPS